MKIKGMDKNMCCRGFQFEVGKEYKIDTKGKTLELCTDTVFHYCNSLEQVHRFYSCKKEGNRYFEIEVLGEEICDKEKCGSNHIKIVREIVGEELENLKGLINGNTGLFNSGSFNSGDFNSGNCNSGNCNSEDYNSGNYNNGNYNSGRFNSGNYNSGDFNSGNCNSGNCNSEDYNSGNYNSGDCNSGRFNSGNYNSGDCNSGYGNSGDYNSGRYNSGIGNSCDYSNGVFCNEKDKNVRIFNQPSGMSLGEFLGSEYYKAIISTPFKLTEWVGYSEEEKARDEKKAKIGGYLKTYSYKEAWRNWWNELTNENKEIIKQIPNFNAEIFKDITGIEVE